MPPLYPTACCIPPKTARIILLASVLLAGLGFLKAISTYSRSTIQARRINGGCWACREGPLSVGVGGHCQDTGRPEIFKSGGSKAIFPCSHTLFKLGFYLLPRKDFPTFGFWIHSHSGTCLSCLSAQNASSWSSESMFYYIFALYPVVVLNGIMQCNVCSG